MLRCVFVFLCIAGLATTSGVAAQEPPTPIGMMLTQTAPGAYQLAVRPAAPVPPYIVRVHVSAIGTDQVFFTDLGESDGSPLTIDLPLPFDGMGDAGCYRVNFFVTTAPETKPGANNDGAGFDTHVCLDSTGFVTFPKFDGVTAPPPPPPTDVRMVRVPGAVGEGDTWRIEWRDNSTDEIAFAPGIILFDRPWAEGGSVIAGVDIPEVPPGWTSVGSIGFLFAPDGPPQPVCGSALVLVFAIGPDGPSVWPGSTTVPACFSTGTISFPDAGGGDPGTGAHGLLAMAFASGAFGMGMLLLVSGLRRHHR